MFHLSLHTFKDSSLNIFSSGHGDGDIKSRQAWQPPAMPALRRQRRGIRGASSLARQTRISELHIHSLRGPATVYSGEQTRKRPNSSFKLQYYTGKHMYVHWTQYTVGSRQGRYPTSALSLYIYVNTCTLFKKVWKLMDYILT